MRYEADPLHPSASCLLSSPQRALLKMTSLLSSEFRRMFESRSGLNVDRLYTVVSHSCGDSIKNWLGAHYQTWKLPASKPTLKKIRADILEGIPDIVDEVPFFLEIRLCKKLNTMSKALFTNMMNYQKPQSAIRRIFREFANEIGSLQTEHSPEAQLRDMIEWLDKWETKAREILKQEEVGCTPIWMA